MRSMILPGHTSLSMHRHVHTNFSENHLQIAMGSYKYGINLAKLCAAIIEWPQRIGDFWIFNHVTTVVRCFSTNFCELDFLAILPHSPL